MIEITNSTYASKCPTNSSCILLIGVVSTAKTNLSSGFVLHSLTSQNKINSTVILNGTIAARGSYDYYWFIINTSATPKWNQFMTSGSSSYDQDVDLYVNAFNGRYPTTASADYKGENYGPDAVNITYADTQVQSAATGGKILLIVGVKANNDNTSYSLFNWGPNALNTSMFNFQDLYLNAS